MSFNSPIVFTVSAWVSLEIYDRVMVHGWSAFALPVFTIIILSAVGLGLSKTSTTRDTRIKL